MIKKVEPRYSVVFLLLLLEPSDRTPSFIQYGLALLLMDRPRPRFRRFTGEVDRDEFGDSDLRYLIGLLDRLLLTLFSLLPFSTGLSLFTGLSAFLSLLSRLFLDLDLLLDFLFLGLEPLLLLDLRPLLPSFFGLLLLLLAPTPAFVPVKLKSTRTFLPSIMVPFISSTASCAESFSS